MPACLPACASRRLLAQNVTMAGRWWLAMTMINLTREFTTTATIVPFVRRVRRHLDTNQGSQSVTSFYGTLSLERDRHSRRVGVCVTRSLTAS